MEEWLGIKRETQCEAQYDILFTSFPQNNMCQFVQESDGKLKEQAMALLHGSVSEATAGELIEIIAGVKIIYPTRGGW